METKLPDLAARHLPAVEDQNAAGEKAPLSEWLRELNQRLTSEGALASEQAFSRGCSTSLVPAGLLVGVAFLLGARHWVSLLLVALAAGMLALAWAAFAASQAQRRSIERVYLASVLPEIEQDLPLRGLTLEQIRQAARQALPEPSPLGTCLEQLSLRALKRPGVEHGE